MTGRFSGGIVNSKMSGVPLIECHEIEQLHPCIYFDDPKVPCSLYCYAKPLMNLRKASSTHVHKATKRKGLIRLGTYIEVLPEMYDQFKAGRGKWSCCGEEWHRVDFPTRRYFMITRGLLDLSFYGKVNADPLSVNIQVSTDIDSETQVLVPDMEKLAELAKLNKVLFRFKSHMGNAHLWADVVRRLELSVGRVMETPIRSRVMETKLLAGHFAYGKQTALEKVGWKTGDFMRCNTACKDCFKENGFLACAVTPGMMARLTDIRRPDPPRHTYDLHAIKWRVESTRALTELGGEASVQDVYAWFQKNHPELEVGKPGWRFKVRAGLNGAGDRVARGRWRLSEEQALKHVMTQALQ